MAEVETLSATQIKDLIVKMSNSEEYLGLKKYYSEESFFKTLGISRDENVHSDFIAWLLKPTSNHELGYYPLKKFLQMLAIVCEQDNNAKAQFSEKYANMFLLEDYELTDACKITREAVTGEIAGFDKSGRVDILLELFFYGDGKILPIIVENKVLSTENDENVKSKPSAKNKQTEKYFEWSKIKYPCGENDPNQTPILIFLAPDFEKEIKCKSEAFIKVSYQNLIDYVIEPCLLNVSNEQAKVLIENYLRCLSNSTIYETLGRNEGRIMGFIGKEKELLEKFYEKNKTLFESVLAMLSKDPNLSEEERKSFGAAYATSTNRKYEFNGAIYGVGPLVLAVVKKWVEDNPGCDFAAVQAAFPDSLVSKTYGVVKPLNIIPAKDLKSPKRYFDDDTIKVDSGKVEIRVCNQWTKEKMPEFIQRANELGYTITPV